MRLKFKCLIALAMCWSGITNAQELAPDEVQINFNTYFDNARVAIVYPDVYVNKSLGEKTTINGRYLVDVISSASMRSHFDRVYSTQASKAGIDAYTSATKKTNGGGDDTPDEMRHEFSFGISHNFSDFTLTLNNIYSTEHDYTSETIAASISMPFAKKNTTVNLGLVRSFDKSSPEIRSWTADKDVWSVNMSLSQIVSLDFIAQAELFYSNLSGYLSDPYQVVKVLDTAKMKLAMYEPVSPDTRNRYAVGLKGLYRVSENSSAELGYRYYTDDWSINSHTINAKYNRMMSDDKIVMSVGYRFYTQSAADFYKPTYYAGVDAVTDANGIVTTNFMTVDTKLDKLNTNEVSMRWTFNGELVPMIRNEKMEVSTQFQYFIRTSEHPDWHSGYKTLYAYLFSIGFRYLF